LTNRYDSIRDIVEPSRAPVGQQLSLGDREPQNNLEDR